VPAQTIVPDAKEYISETIDDPRAIYDSAIWDTPGFALVLSWLARKWQRKMSEARTSEQQPGAAPDHRATKGMSRLRCSGADP
jgi:hypothetical protein